MKKLLAAVGAGAMLFANALPVLAHEATSFKPGPGCMGELTSFHAQNPEHGLRHSAEGMPHAGIANKLSVSPAENFQEFMKLNQMWCKSYKDK